MATRKSNGNGKKPAAPKTNPEVVEKTLDTVKNGDTPKAPTRGENRRDKRFLGLSMQTYTMAISQAMLNRRVAIRIEMAVGMSVFSYQQVSDDSRASIQAIYAEVGYDCKDSNGKDYKTIRRRINAAAELYEFLGEDEIDNIVEGKAETEELKALVEYIEKEYPELSTINGVFAICGKEVEQTNTPEYRERRSTTAGGGVGSAPPQGQAGQGGVNAQGQTLTKGGTVDKRVAPAGGQSLATQGAKGNISKEEANAQAGKAPEQGQPQPSGEDKGVLARVGEFLREHEATQLVRQNQPQRRATDSPNCVMLVTEHMNLAIPHGTTKAEVMELMYKLMKVAQSLGEDTDVVDDSVKGDELRRSGERTH